jgi:hypothetical protein
MLESVLGFDRGLYLAESAIWEALGYKSPMQGALLPYYDWPPGYGPKFPHSQLPPYRLNLFLQAKRPHYYKKKARKLGKAAPLTSPHWGFKIDDQQQKLLEVLAKKTTGDAHVAYACAAFHSNLALFTHTRERTIVANSTFPAALSLAGHTAWYYDIPGAVGIANPTPEHIEDLPLMERVRRLASEGRADDGAELAWIHRLAGQVIEATHASEAGLDAKYSQFFDDLQTLERLSERYELRRSLSAYMKVRVFSARFDLNWFVVAATGRSTY